MGSEGRCVHEQQTPSPSPTLFRPSWRTLLSKMHRNGGGKLNEKRNSQQLRQESTIHCCLRVYVNPSSPFLRVMTGCSESHQLFACGDNSYFNLSTPLEPGSDPCDNFTTTPTAVVDSFKGLGHSRILSIACSDFASFALVDKPIDDDSDSDSVFKQRPNELHIKSAKKRQKDNEPKEVNEFNHVYSWGRGERGVLGHGTTESQPVPRIIDALNYYKVTQLAAGRQHVLALTESHGVFAFGNGGHGQLGLGTTSDCLVPTHVDTLEGIHVTFVAAGDEFSAALTDTAGSRQVFMWGCGKHGVLGNGNDDDKLKPTRVQALRGTKVRKLACGGSHTLVVTEPAGAKLKGTTVVMSWGWGLYGQLGHRDNWDVATPKLVDEILHERIVSVSGGARHSLALSESGNVWVWGQGIHAHQPAVGQPKDWTSSALLFPRKVYLPNIHVVGGVAGRGRTFVWGDRATTSAKEHRQVSGIDTLSSESHCSMSSASTVLSSNSLRVLYACGSCQMGTVCVVCAARCHGGHCLTLRWTLDNCLSRDCDCHDTGKCQAMAGDRSFPGKDE
ncbi:hypothetical protein, variant [Aphanomyces astaci]|uniref:RCC1-like domain-containing protein n=1 Tax=Aphanomyces astaci TaxID=112090 RepID=W4H863_APHAT|nr:hypothetical protein, variant [Aphanomyces astaci]ETV87761.1 hypothetical protein, variant [Aphanomyces astaci]|eukprot:XP_009822624.1 hypothetical protein, variant [Aphanomyces astaci]